MLACAEHPSVLGSTNPCPIAVHMEPFSTSAFKVLISIFATTKICRSFASNTKSCLTTPEDPIPLRHVGVSFVRGPPKKRVGFLLVFPQFNRGAWFWPLPKWSDSKHLPPKNHRGPLKTKNWCFFSPSAFYRQIFLSSWVLLEMTLYPQ